MKKASAQVEQDIRGGCVGQFHRWSATMAGRPWVAKAVRDFTFIRNWREVSNYQIELIVVQCHGILFLRDWLRGK